MYIIAEARADSLKSRNNFVIYSRSLILEWIYRSLHFRILSTIGLYTFARVIKSDVVYNKKLNFINGALN